MPAQLYSLTACSRDTWEEPCFMPSLGTETMWALLLLYGTFTTIPDMCKLNGCLIKDTEDTPTAPPLAVVPAIQLQKNVFCVSVSFWALKLESRKHPNLQASHVVRACGQWLRSGILEDAILAPPRCWTAIGSARVWRNSVEGFL